MKKYDENCLVENANGAKKYDADKLRYDLIPAKCLAELSEILTFGANKYSPNNWMNLEPDRIYSALMRHLEAWRMNDNIDKDSGYHHLAHVFCNAMFLLYISGSRTKQAECMVPHNEQILGDYKTDHIDPNKKVMINYGADKGPDI